MEPLFTAAVLPVKPLSLKHNILGIGQTCVDIQQEFCELAGALLTPVTRSECGQNTICETMLMSRQPGGVRHLRAALDIHGLQTRMAFHFLPDFRHHC
jgi:hypothetical protein